MKNREIKFKFWNHIVGRMSACYTLPELHKEKVNFTNLIPLQYTGLKDKNSKEIYEGDILSYDYADNKEFKDWMKLPFVEVGYERDYVICGKDIDPKRKCYLHGFRFQFTEVLGNVFEHPELLTPTSK
jgi:uncharacterized phage protein (TIGR01671 family)